MEAGSALVEGGSYLGTREEESVLMDDGNVLPEEQAGPLLVDWPHACLRHSNTNITE